MLAQCQYETVLTFSYLGVDIFYRLYWHCVYKPKFDSCYYLFKLKNKKNKITHDKL